MLIGGRRGEILPILRHAGISDDFIRDVEAMMKPGTSALFVLDDEGDMDMILQKPTFGPCRSGSELFRAAGHASRSAA
jgi:uncharacterized membrane protein